MIIIMSCCYSNCIITFLIGLHIEIQSKKIKTKSIVEIIESYMSHYMYINVHK